MPANSLYKTAVHRLILNKDGIEDVGDIPYSKIRPVLLKLDRPEQLAAIEANSPQLLGETAEIWRAFLLRDVQDYDRNPVEPKDGKSWWKTYRKVKKWADEEQARQEEELVSQLTARREERDANTTTISTKMVVPRNERKKVKQASMTHSHVPDSSRLHFGGGTKTRVNTGAGVMRQVRREMAERQTRLHSLGTVPQRNIQRGKVTQPPTAARTQPAPPARPIARAAVSATEAPRAPHKPLAPSKNPRLAAMASVAKKPSPSPAPSRPAQQPPPKQQQQTHAHAPASATLKRKSPPTITTTEDDRPGPPKRKPPASSVFMPQKKRKL